MRARSRGWCSGLCVALLVSTASLASAQTTADGLTQRPSGITLAPKAATPPSVKSLFTSIKSDLLQLPKRDNLQLIGVGVMAALASTSFDSAIDGSDWGRGRVGEALEPGQVVGGFLTQTGAAFATYAIGRIAGSPRTAEVGGELVRAQILAQATTQLIKLGTQRTRPDGTTLSFPSGHTSASFATATVLQQNFGWKAGLPAYAMATWVGASRIQTKRHHLSDVVAGAALGILAGRAVTVGSGSARFSLSPTFVPGGAGITFVRIR